MIKLLTWYLIYESYVQCGTEVMTPKRKLNYCQDFLFVFCWIYCFILVLLFYICWICLLTVFISLFY